MIYFFKASAPQGTSSVLIDATLHTAPLPVPVTPLRRIIINLSIYVKNAEQDAKQSHKPSPGFSAIAEIRPLKPNSSSNSGHSGLLHTPYKSEKYGSSSHLSTVPQYVPDRNWPVCAPHGAPDLPIFATFALPFLSNPSYLTAQT